MTRYTMKELPVLERPYEKLETYGEKALSNAELLAIIIKSGTKEETSLQVAQRVLNECCAGDDCFSLRNVSLDSLMSIKGIGRVKAILLKAVFELANRIDSTVIEKPLLSHSTFIGEYLMNVFGNEKQEKFKVLCLDVKGRLQRDETVAIGGRNYLELYPVDVLRVPVELGCYDVIIAHNHPSGDPTPTEEDVRLTARLVNAAKMMGINILDHFVVGDGKYIGIRASKLLKW